MPGTQVSSHPRSSLHHSHCHQISHHLMRPVWPQRPSLWDHLMCGHGQESGGYEALGELGEGRQAQQQHPDRCGRHWTQGRPRHRWEVTHGDFDIIRDFQYDTNTIRLCFPFHSFYRYFIHGFISTGFISHEDQPDIQRDKDLKKKKLNHQRDSKPDTIEGAGCDAKGSRGVSNADIKMKRIIFKESRHQNMSFWFFSIVVA